METNVAVVVDVEAFIYKKVIGIFELFCRENFTFY